MTAKRFEKFVKKSVIVEAYQTDEECYIETLEGTMKADKGDWIIRGVKGELYSCKPDVFEMTYEKMDWMTENKRFYRVGGYVYDRDKCISHYRDEIVKLLNELHEENKRLTSDLAYTKVLFNSMKDKYSGLLKLVHGFNGDVE